MCIYICVIIIWFEEDWQKIHSTCHCLGDFHYNINCRLIMWPPPPPVMAPTTTCHGLILSGIISFLALIFLFLFSTFPSRLMPLWVPFRCSPFGEFSSKSSWPTNMTTTLFGCFLDNYNPCPYLNSLIFQTFLL